MSVKFNEVLLDECFSILPVDFCLFHVGLVQVELQVDCVVDQRIFRVVLRGDVDAGFPLLEGALSIL